MAERYRVYPQCEICWVDENSEWEADGVTADGKLVARIKAIAIPLDLEPGTVHACCSCGELTVVGIFVDKNPEDVKFDIDPKDIVE